MDCWKVLFFEQLKYTKYFRNKNKTENEKKRNAEKSAETVRIKIKWQLPTQQDGAWSANTGPQLSKI